MQTTVKESLWHLLEFKLILQGTTAGTIDPCANANLNGIIQTQFTTDSTTCDGIVKVQGTGGTAPYTYLWNTNSTNVELDSVCVGDYQVTITDNNGCVRELHAFVGFEGTTAVDPCANNNLQGDIHTMPVTDSVNCKVQFKFMHQEVKRRLCFHGIMELQHQLYIMFVMVTIM
jgi:hypothetical protein